jgi:hypothetical protein
MKQLAGSLSKRHAVKLINPFKPEGLNKFIIVLPQLVSIEFQVLFHSPKRGAFHLSLTVLVHYRLSVSI